MSYTIYLALSVAWHHVGIIRGFGVWAERFASTDSQSYIYLIGRSWSFFLSLSRNAGRFVGCYQRLQCGSAWLGLCLSVVACHGLVPHALRFAPTSGFGGTGWRRCRMWRWRWDGSFSASLEMS